MPKFIISKELKEILTKMNCEASNLLIQEGEVNVELLAKPDKILNYFDISHTTKGHISYLSKERIEQIENSDDKNFWDAKRRYHARPGSVIKKLFKLHNHYIEEFATKYTSMVNPPTHKLEVVKGEDIAKYYNRNNYYEMRGSLGGSCMCSVLSEFFDIYVKNPDQINMLVMLDENNKVMGRALIWNGNGFNLMDRIYVCNDNYYHIFVDWAKEHGYYYKEQNNWHTPRKLMLNGEKMEGDFEIKLENIKFERYPYLDTFKWLDESTKTLYNYTNKEMSKNEKMITLNDHQGRYMQSDYMGFCDISGNLYNNCDLVYLDYLNKTVYQELCVWSDVFKSQILEKHSRREVFTGDFIYNEEYDHLNDYKLISDKKKELEERKSKKYYPSGSWDDDYEWWKNPPKTRTVNAASTTTSTGGYSGALRDDDGNILTENPCTEMVAEISPRIETIGRDMNELFGWAAVQTNTSNESEV